MADGYTLRPYQLEVIEDTEAALMFGSTNVVVESPPACVPGFTEFLTPNGWKRIDEYKYTDSVCVWNQDGSTKFEEPLKYINQNCKDNFINIKTNGIDITVSDNHKMPYLTNKGRKNSKHSVKNAKELFKIGEISIPRKFSSPVFNNKIDFTVDEMKVLIMQAADGSIINLKSENTIRINLKKERKKERARLLLKNANIKYKEKIQTNGYSVFTYKFKCSLKDLSFLYLLTQYQLCSLIYDIIFWDGSNPNKDRFNYTGATFHGNKRDVDAAQYALSAALGKYVSIYKDKRQYKNEDIYSCRVSLNDKSFIKTRRNDGAKSAEISSIEPEGDKHYCFETSTGFWLMRQNNQIYPTGNSGKSFLISETAYRLAKRHPNKKIVISITISALLDQIAHHLKLVGTDYSILKAGRDSEFDPEKQIQLCQAQTLHARIDKLETKANYFIMDEVHREYQTKRTSEIIDKLDIEARIGYSGTPYDEAGFLLDNCELLRTTTAIDLQNQGYLCPIKYFVPKWAESVDFSNLKKSGNDYSEKDLNDIINTDNHLKMAIESMNQMNAKSKKTMVFCSGVEQADKFAKMLQDNGYNAYSYHSKTDKKEAEKILNAFINNEKYVQNIKESDQPTLFDNNNIDELISGSDVTCLVSINKLGIGFDCPDVRLGVQLRPTKIKSLFIQQVMRLARIHPSKDFSEYLDLGQTLSSHGFHTDIYNPPKRTGDKKIDAEALAEANQNNLEDLSAILTNDLESIDFNTYNLRIEKIKASLQKDLYSLSIKELAAAFDISKDHKEIITIATIIYTHKYGRPVSKAGYEYDYRPENFWSTSTFGDNEDFHVLYSMDEYFKMYPEMKTQWIKSLRTRCRNIVKEGKKLNSITGFIKFLANKYEEENYEFKEEEASSRPYESGYVSTSGYGSSMKHTTEIEYDDYGEEIIPF